MPIYYMVQWRKNPRKPDDPAKYYLIARRWQMVTRDMFIKDMVRHTSMSAGEAAAAIDFMFERIPHYLERGLVVNLGKLGYFKCSVSADSAEDCISIPAHRLVKKVRARFYPGKELREMINNIPVEPFPKY